MINRRTELLSPVFQSWSAIFDRWRKKVNWSVISFIGSIGARFELVFQMTVTENYGSIAQLRHPGLDSSTVSISRIGTETWTRSERLRVKTCWCFASSADSQWFIEHQHHVIQCANPSLERERPRPLNTTLTETCKLDSSLQKSNHNSPYVPMPWAFAFHEIKADYR